MNIEEINSTIIKEANEILYTLGLTDVLKKLETRTLAEVIF